MKELLGQSHTSRHLAEEEVRNSTLARHPLSFGAHQRLLQYPLPAMTRGRRGERLGINGLIRRRETDSLTRPKDLEENSGHLMKETKYETEHFSEGPS